MPIPSDEVVRLERVSKRFRFREAVTLKEFLPKFVLGRGYLPSFYALREIDLTLMRGETLGILGANGSGKSTILKLIAGVMVPTEGRVLVSGKVSPLIELGTGFHPDLTGRENVFLGAALLGLRGSEVRRRLETILAFADLSEFVDTPVKRYSSGMFMRLAFSLAVHADPQILLVDEALSVGDEAFQEKCNEKLAALKQAGVSIAFVSHNLELVQKFCDRAIVLDHGHLVFDGVPDAAVHFYQGRVLQQRLAIPGTGNVS